MPPNPIKALLHRRTVFRVICREGHPVWISEKHLEWYRRIRLVKVVHMKASDLFRPWMSQSHLWNLSTLIITVQLPNEAILPGLLILVASRCLNLIVGVIVRPHRELRYRMIEIFAVQKQEIPGIYWQTTVTATAPCWCSDLAAGHLCPSIVNRLWVMCLVVTCYLMEDVEVWKQEVPETCWLTTIQAPYHRTDLAAVRPCPTMMNRLRAVILQVLCVMKSHTMEDVEIWKQEVPGVYRRIVASASCQCPDLAAVLLMPSSASRRCVVVLQVMSGMMRRTWDVVPAQPCSRRVAGSASSSSSSSSRFAAARRCCSPRSWRNCENSGTQIRNVLRRFICPFRQDMFKRL